MSLLAACFIHVSCLAYSSTLKMEAACSSESWVDFLLTAWRCIPKGRTLHYHGCALLAACLVLVFCVAYSSKVNATVSPKCLLTFSELHGVISQKVEHFLQIVIRHIFCTLERLLKIPKYVSGPSV
jgi:uncharacterized membrane protein YozB (DUF420 family)